MKTIGLLGGMSWESTLDYYRIMNQAVNSRLKKAHSAKLIMYSFDFQMIKENMDHGNWQQIKADLIKQSMHLKNAGAELMVICTNTLHVMAADIEAATGLEVVHIAEVTGQAIKKRGLKKVLLLGTQFTMEGTFYKSILKDKYGIEVVIPNVDHRRVIHEIIFEELIKGIISKASKAKCLEIIHCNQEVEGVVLGCTEIPMLVKQEDLNMPVFDTTTLHAVAAIEAALG